MKGLKRIVETIEKANTVVVAGHINPDGDSIGSMLSLGLALSSIGKRVYLICDDEIPPKYRALPGAKKIRRGLKEECDLAISVDCSNKEILGGAYKAFSKAKQIIEIDHHECRRPFGDMDLIDYQASAVGEQVYLLLKKLNIDITKDIAQNILTSIIVETNSFRLPTVNSSTLSTAAKLIDKGVDFHKLSKAVFWSQTRESVLLSGICLSRCKFLKKDKLVWSIIRGKDFKLIKGKDYDVDAVAESMRSIKGIEIAILFREREDNQLRVSLRSTGEINVASIAEQFGGGGHFDIAGCYIPNKACEIEKLIKLSTKAIK